MLVSLIISNSAMYVHSTELASCFMFCLMVVRSAKTQSPGKYSAGLLQRLELGFSWRSGRSRERLARVPPGIKRNFASSCQQARGTPVLRDTLLGIVRNVSRMNGVQIDLYCTYLDCWVRAGSNNADFQTGFMVTDKTRPRRRSCSIRSKSNGEGAGASRSNTSPLNNDQAISKSYSGSSGKDKRSSETPSRRRGPRCVSSVQLMLLHEAQLQRDECAPCMYTYCCVAHNT